MTRDSSVPCFAEIDDWPEPVNGQVRLGAFGRMRDGGPQGGTFYVELIASKVTYPFFFDRFLGRLCYGADEHAKDAAYLKRGSRIEQEAFELLENLAKASARYEEVARCLTHARNWT